MANYPPYMMPQQGYSGFMQPPQMMPQDAFLCRPVASREEAIGTPTDFTRPILMPDIGHGMVYMKRFNPNTGSSDFMDFKLFVPTEAPSAQDYITRQEFEMFSQGFDKFCADMMRRIAGAGKESSNE